jgi:hypothetical protein
MILPFGASMPVFLLFPVANYLLLFLKVQSLILSAIVLLLLPAVMADWE